MKMSTATKEKSLNISKTYLRGKNEFRQKSVLKALGAKMDTASDLFDAAFGDEEKTAPTAPKTEPEQPPMLNLKKDTTSSAPVLSSSSKLEKEKLSREVPMATRSSPRKRAGGLPKITATETALEDPFGFPDLPLGSPDMKTNSEETSFCFQAKQPAGKIQQKSSPVIPNPSAGFESEEESSSENEEDMKIRSQESTGSLTGNFGEWKLGTPPPEKMEEEKLKVSPKRPLAMESEAAPKLFRSSSTSGGGTEQIPRSSLSVYNRLGAEKSVPSVRANIKSGV